MRMELTDLDRPHPFEYEGETIEVDYEEAMLLFHTDDGRYLYSTLHVKDILLTKEVRAVFNEMRAMVRELNKVAEEPVAGGGRA